MSIEEEKGGYKATVNEQSISGLERDELTGEISELTVVAEGEERTTLFVWILVLCCSISGLLFGEALHEAQKQRTHLSFLQVMIPV